MLFILSIDFALISMERCRARHIYGHYLINEYATYRYYSQQLDRDIFLVVREVIDGWNQGEKEVVVVRLLENCYPIVLKHFAKDDAPAIASEIIRKFANQHEEFAYLVD